MGIGDQSLTKEDNFEEISESKEIIEDRIGRIKATIIDLTLKQQELGEKTRSLEKDIEILQLKLEDTAN
jgi:peptidoglycan hydrolase CwlO-like protein